MSTSTGPIPAAVRPTLHMLMSETFPTIYDWRVQVDMPYIGTGWQRGERAGWLNLNNIRGGRKAKIDRGYAAQAWRIAARDAFRDAQLPQGLPRLFARVQVLFPDARRRDPANWEPTVKPGLDALQPEEQLKNRRGAVTGIAYGWGVIPGDDPRYLVRGAEIPTGVLPAGSDTPGAMVFYLTALEAGL